MGFLGALGSIVGGVAGFVVGGPAGAVAGFKGGGSIGGALESRKTGPAGATSVQTIRATTPYTTRLPGSGLLGTVGRSLALPGGAPPLLPAPTVLPGGSIQLPDSVKVSGVTTPFGSAGSATAYFTQPGAPTGSQPCGANGKMRATHANKSGYYLKGGTYVAPGTRCVANRRLNPLNPRALSRSMRRVTSARRAIKSIIAFDRTLTPGGKIRVGKRPARKG